MCLIMDPCTEIWRDHVQWLCQIEVLGRILFEENVLGKICAALRLCDLCWFARCCRWDAAYMLMQVMISDGWNTLSELYISRQQFVVWCWRRLLPWFIRSQTLSPLTAKNIMCVVRWAVGKTIILCLLTIHAMTVSPLPSKTKFFFSVSCSQLLA